MALAAVLAAVALVAQPAASAAADAPPPARVLVRMAPGVALPPDAQPLIDDWVVVDVPTGTRMEAAAAELLRDRDVVDVEAATPYDVVGDPILVPDPGPGDLTATAANDPLLWRQWHLAQIGATQAWATTKGAGVTVAVLDTGVSREGKDLGCGGYAAEYDAITRTAGKGVADDTHGHGTHVAGTIAQCTNNGIGAAGVAPGVVLMPIKVIPGTSVELVRGLEWARMNGAKVVNLSIGRRCALGEGTAWPGCSDQAVNVAIDAAVAAGIVVVAAAGNDNAAHVLFPANHPKVIAVGATDARRARAPYSNRGAALDLVAPGGNLDRFDAGTGSPDGVLQETRVGGTWGYWLMQGTSMAAPHVSGAAALLLSVRPALTPAQVRSYLTATARDLGAPGKDPEFGAGELRVVQALAAARSGTVPPGWPARARLRYDLAPAGLRLGWPAAKAPAGLAAYDVYRDGRLVGTTTSHRTVMTGLTTGRRYTFAVRARDQKGVRSQALTVSVRPVSGFRDTSGTTFATDIRWLATGEITRGCNPPRNDRFCPSDAVTREQMAAFLVRAGELRAISGVRFRDVQRTSTFATDVDRLATAGITMGCNPPRNDRFCPSDPVTREQMAAFLVRTLRLQATSGVRFRDVPRTSTFATDVDRLATAGITMGCNPPRNDRFCPSAPVSRGQMAAFLRRAMAA